MLTALVSKWLAALKDAYDINTFRNHIYSVYETVSIHEQRTLTDAGDGVSTISNSQIENGNSDFETDFESPSAFTTMEPCDQNNVQQLQFFDNQLQRSSALLLLGLKEKHKLPQTTVQGIVNGVTGLFHQHVDTLKSQVITC